MAPTGRAMAVHAKAELMAAGLEGRVHVRISEPDKRSVLTIEVGVDRRSSTLARSDPGLLVRSDPLS